MPPRTTNATLRSFGALAIIHAAAARRSPTTTNGGVSDKGTAAPPRRTSSRQIRNEVARRKPRAAYAKSSVAWPPIAIHVTAPATAISRASRRTSRGKKRAMPRPR